MAVSLSPLRHSLQTSLRVEKPEPKKAANDRNILKVVLGDLLFDTWYGSFYPDELVGGGKIEIDRLYVCQWCFKYSRELMPYMAHLKLCPSKAGPPPGRLIYVRDCYSVHEVDGEDHQLFCQDLSLFAKLFLENKSVCFDLTTFNYYLLIYTSSTPAHPSRVNGSTSHQQVIGFFSKEKLSWDNNNVACILVFPPWQRKGLGQILMGVSYELSKQEGRLGGPEKPLSNLGRRGYLAFWSSVIARHILSIPPRRATTIKSISDETYILPDDVILALKDMDVLETKKRADGTAIVNQARVRKWISTHRVDLEPIVDPRCFLARSIKPASSVKSGAQ